MACLCFAGCGPRDGAYDPSNFSMHGRFAPMDVAVPDTFGEGPTDFNGLYGEGPSVLACCWIAPRATLLVRKKSPAQTLVAGFRVQPLARFAKGQTVRISFAGVHAAPYVETISWGQEMLKIPVPASLRNATGLIPITITCDLDYVPSRDSPPQQTLFTLLHLRTLQPNTDSRRLGIILLYLYFQ